MKFKLGYTNEKSKIPSAVTNGTIDSGDLIIVDENNLGEFAFVKEDGSILEFSAATSGKVDNSFDIVDSEGNVIKSFDGSEPIELTPEILNELGVLTPEEMEQLILETVKDIDVEDKGYDQWEDLEEPSEDIIPIDTTELTKEAIQILIDSSNEIALTGVVDAELSLTKEVTILGANAGISQKFEQEVK